MTMLNISYSVFVSHSKDDKRVSFFSQAFANSGVRAIFEEFDPKAFGANPPWIKIKNDIKSSIATFVMLSEPLEEKSYRHSMNWIDFEVGIAAANNRPVWIFEPSERHIDFAVPYATHHVYYDWNSKDNLMWLIKLLQEEKFAIDKKTSIVCPKCHLRFMEINHGNVHFNCPSCRKELVQTS